MPSPPTTVTRPVSWWAVVVAGALTGVAVCAVVGWLVLVAVLVWAPAIPAGLCVFWLAHTAAATGLARRAGAPPGAATWVGGLVVGAVAVGAVVWWIVELGGPVEAVPVVDGAVFALGLLVWRTAAGGVRPWQAGAGALGVVAAAALVLVAMSDPFPASERALPSSPVPISPAPGRAIAPAAPQPPSPAPVDAAVACAPGDLDWSVTGWDAAMGTRAVTVVATSRAAHACYVDGFAGITIVQGGRDLRLTAEPGSPTGSETPEPRRVGVAPGGAASFGLVWKGYGAAADELSPQELRVTLDGAGPRTVPLGGSPAPFDLVDGGTVRVGPWQPGP